MDFTQPPLLKYEMDDSEDEDQNGTHSNGLDFQCNGMSVNLKDAFMYATTSTGQSARSRLNRKRSYSSGSEEQFARLKPKRSASATEKRLKREAEHEAKRVQDLIASVRSKFEYVFRI
jgi:hypothetical protein